MNSDMLSKMQKDWQGSADILARIIRAAACLIIRFDEDDGEVFVSSNTTGNIYHVGERYKIADSGFLVERIRTTNKHLLVSDVESQEEWKESPSIKNGVKSYLGWPINWSDGTVFGALVILDNKPNKFSHEYIELTKQFKLLIEKYLELVEKNETIEYLASIDSLTRIYNRRVLFEKFTEELNRSFRYGRELSVLMIDVDHFKTINDKYGHPVGDTVLEEIAQEINSMKRSVDIFGRYGGEEFIIIMPETCLEKAMIFAERIRNKIKEMTIFNGPNNIKATISIGVTEKNGDINIFSIIERADNCLLEAKKTRDCVYGECHNA